ncbi:transcriptional regulator [Mesorhizobium australicum WSM2073]|uniref:Transcriptional regulator n=1 Tax=Mesorhizobium australicum (strain HAMBI 3006 / LMG 24608 / WSM2073) TaxID=754035 RepID=L0KJQ3_MESAW|nr:MULTISPECIES: LysR family transcriptional regulator [Mesorhizobium]AGB44760.1 transcriptional regulator [Mesorhizobium australicum WSM2073]MBZ9978182.1 LysR family transcriptional regulator [Mesorhizobium sp. BR-1-1-10]
MAEFTLHDLQCFDAVIRCGGFQPAAALLHRSHPAVFAAVARLERQLDLVLLDRGGYRVRATEAGLSFHRRAQSLLRELEGLSVHAAQLSMGEESDIHVVIGDLCPRPHVLGMLGRFFAQCPGTRLHLHFEAVGGPWERLFDDKADLILHWIDKGDVRVEWIDLSKVSFIPVVAPGFLPERVDQPVTLEKMQAFTQCVMRDTALHSPRQDYFVAEGAPQCLVPDQAMKKELILQGLGWGHLPHFLIAEELHDGQLISIAGSHLPGRTDELVVARRRDRPHGPIANRLWDHIQQEAPALRRALEPRA